MRVKPENFHLLRKYGFSKGFDMEDHFHFKFEISTESYWAKISNYNHSMFIVINEQGVICVHHVNGEKSGYDIPLPDVLVKMWKDGIIDTQLDHHNILIEVAKLFYGKEIKTEDYLSQYVVKLSKEQLVNTFLKYVLENNAHTDSCLHLSDDQVVVYFLGEMERIKYTYLAHYGETIDDLIKKHDHEENLIITRVNNKNKEIVTYLKLNGEIAYKIL